MKKPATSSRTRVALAAKRPATRTAKVKTPALPANPKELAALKLSRLSGDDKIAARLVKSGIGSVRQLAVLPARTLRDRFGGKQTRSDEQKIYRAQTNARYMMAYIADQAMTVTLAGSLNGIWGVGGFAGKKPKPVCNCGCCGSIFSLKAYLFDLMDLLAHYWSIDLTDVEALLQRSFSEHHVLDRNTFLVTKDELNCEALNAPLPQVRIAVEVLETYLGKIGKNLPTGNASWKEKFVTGLLRLITPREVQIAVSAAAAPANKLSVANLELQPNLPADFAAALAAWKAKLNTLVLNLAAIDEAVGLLSDYAQNFTGFAADTLQGALAEDATPEQRRQYEVTLQFEQAREVEARQWLTDYRDALVNAAEKGVNVLEVSLSISLNSGSCRTTTRLQELVTSVQQIVENIRSGEIAALDRPDIAGSRAVKVKEAVDLPLAEEAWVRLRDYETWLGYMYGWVYPENVISPVAIADDKALTHVGEFFRTTIQPLLRGEKAVDDTYIELSLADDYARFNPDIPPPARRKREAFAAWIARVDHYHELGRDQISDMSFGSDFERYLLFPLLAGSLLNERGQFAQAQDWYGFLYNPVTRKHHWIFDQVVDQAAAGSASATIHAGDFWLDDLYEPAAIASRRRGVWLRNTILAMVQNLIEWADEDFVRGLPDTLQRAEERYEFAQKLLGAQNLKNECELIVYDIRKVIEDHFGPKKDAVKSIAPLAEVRSIAALKQAAGAIRKAATGKGSIRRRQAAVVRAVDSAVARDRKEHPSQSLAAEWNARLKNGQAFEDEVFFQPDPDGPFPPVPEPGPGNGRPGRPPNDFPFDRPGKPDRPFDEPIDPPSPPGPSPVVSLEFCVPLNPVLGLLGRQIDAQLGKLGRCLDFVGEPQIPRVYDCDTYDPTTGLINRPISALDQFNYTTDQPRYRYNFLVEKARQYVDVAERIGSLLLQALQNRDNEAFQQLKAEHAIELAEASVELKRLGQVEAGHGVDIAKLQSERADSQVTFWEARAGDDIQSYEDTLSPDESRSLSLMGASLEKQNEAANLLNLAALPVGIAAGAGAGLAAGGALATASGVGAPVGIPSLAIGIGVLAGTAALLPAVASARQAEASALSQEASLASSRASFERRFEEWKNQFTLAKFDAQIADLQETLAGDRLAIADQEMVIAQLQLSQAREELRFLQTKITDVALYDWMVRVLSRDYRVLMQIATCVARMAQRAIEFERQEAIRIIVGDYWKIATGVLNSPDLTDEQRGLGLLGAERLLTDLTKLDAFKLVTERRRQQISKTISLARMMPTELIAFRRSGTITFNTLLDWFDDDFLGHYLRLIKCVKVSILAIVPPIDGIHATLQNTGESSVVVTDDGGRTFVKRRAMRNFGERISLDSAFNESGLFVLNYEDAMLLPFEGLGVETQWTLELPRGNNRFNFDTIADVFLTIDYTADHSRVYEDLQRDERSRVDVHEDTAVPLRLQFPDLWYHMKNQRPDAAGAPFQFKFELPRAAFAQNLADPITVEHLTVLVSGDLNSAEQDLVADGLSITHRAAAGSPADLHDGVVPRPGPPVVAGDASSAFGYPLFGPDSILLSTRGDSANGLPANPAIGTAAPDEWTIELSAGLFPAVVDKISDVLFVVTVRGRRL